MKVKDLIKILSDFNPNAEVNIIYSSIEHDITDYGWESSDTSVVERDITHEKITAKAVSLFTYEETKECTK